MKKILSLLALGLLLNGCAIQEDMSAQCSGDLALGCRNLFGTNTSRIDNNTEAINNLQKQINELKAEIDINIISINSLSLSNAQSEADKNALQAQINALQVTVNSQVAQLVALQSETRVVGLIEPCGHVNNVFNEVLIRLSNGATLAYFEQGSQRFLSSLVPGSYQTTDSKHCAFSVNSAGKVCDNLGCR
jgi:hypothetical protein